MLEMYTIGYFHKIYPTHVKPILILPYMWPYCTPHFKVEYHANENPLKNYEKIAYVGQRPYHASILKMPFSF